MGRFTITLPAVQHLSRHAARDERAQPDERQAAVPGGRTDAVTSIVKSFAVVADVQGGRRARAVVSEHLEVDMTELDAARDTTRDTGFVPRLHYGIYGGGFSGAVIMPLLCAFFTSMMWASWSTPGFVLRPSAPVALSLTGFLVGLVLHVAAIVLGYRARSRIAVVVGTAVIPILALLSCVSGWFGDPDAPWAHWNNIDTGSFGLLLVGFIVVPGMTINRFFTSRSYRDLH